MTTRIYAVKEDDRSQHYFYTEKEWDCKWWVYSLEDIKRRIESLKNDLHNYTNKKKTQEKIQEMEDEYNEVNNLAVKYLSKEKPGFRPYLVEGKRQL